MDAYYAFDGRELQNERTIDLNRETAAEADGISPENVPVWMAHRIERQDGSTDTVETCNALCAHIRSLDEAAADEIREHMAEVETLQDIVQQLRTENERLREQVTNAGMYLLSAEQGWTDANDRAELRRLLPTLNLSTPETRAILARTLKEYMQRRAA